eukprot:301760-Hanusia_phi.AAC.1
MARRRTAAVRHTVHWAGVLRLPHPDRSAGRRGACRPGPGSPALSSAAGGGGAAVTASLRVIKPPSEYVNLELPWPWVSGLSSPSPGPRPGRPRRHREGGAFLLATVENQGQDPTPVAVRARYSTTYFSLSTHPFHSEDPTPVALSESSMP